MNRPLPLPRSEPVRGLDGYLVAGALMLLAPASLLAWAWAAWARPRTARWTLPAWTAFFAVCAVGMRELLAAGYQSLGADLAAIPTTQGLRPSWAALGAVVGVLGRSLIITAPVGIPVGLVAGQLAARTVPVAPVPLPASGRPVPERIERSTYLAVARDSMPPGDLPGEWRRGRFLVIPPREAGLSSIVVGRPGSGKTKLVARDAYLRARVGQRGVFTDCKGEIGTAEEVVDAYRQGWADGGQPGTPSIHVWPQTPLSAWTGGPVAVANRLLACWAWNPRNEFFREPMALALRLALTAPTPEVTSSADLIERLRPGVLQRLWEEYPKERAQLRSLEKDNRLDDVSLRVGNLMASLGHLLDGDPARPLGTADFTVISLPVMAAEHDASQILRVLLADLAFWVVQRKPAGERAFITVDEMSAVEGGRQHMIHIAERGRSAGVACMMCVQSDQGLGDDHDVNRLIGAVNRVVLFSTAEPDRLIRLAGSRRLAEETSTSWGDHGTTTTTSRVWKDQVDPNVVRALPVGHAFIMAGGRAQLCQVIQAPTGPPSRAGLPELEAP